jgi:hypothetical protein
MCGLPTRHGGKGVLIRHHPPGIRAIYLAKESKIFTAVFLQTKGRGFSFQVVAAAFGHAQNHHPAPVDAWARPAGRPGGNAGWPGC